MEVCDHLVVGQVRNDLKRGELDNDPLGLTRSRRESRESRRVIFIIAIECQEFVGDSELPYRPRTGKVLLSRIDHRIPKSDPAAERLPVANRFQAERIVSDRKAPEEELGKSATCGVKIAEFWL